MLAEERRGGGGNLMLPQIGAVVSGVALMCPALTMPLVLACIAGLTVAAIQEHRETQPVPEVEPPAKPRSRRSAATRQEVVHTASEDSFPASDPPAWTPVTGTGTRH